MQRCVGEHDAEVGVPGSDGRGEAACLSRDKDDRRLGRREHPQFQLCDLCDPPGGGRVRDHHRQGLLFAVFSLAQPPNRRVAGGVHQQMEPSESLDRHDLSSTDPLDRCGDRLVPFAEERPGAVQQPELRPAIRAGVGLGMEPAVAGIVVFGPAPGTLRKTPHGGVRAVIREPLNDAETRAAVRAVGERIAIAAVGGIQEFREALRAGRDVRKDERADHSAGRALQDLEAGVTGRVDERGFEALDERAGGEFGLEPGEEGSECVLCALNVDRDALRGVPDVTVEPELGSQTIDERAESDPLHSSAHGNMCPHHHPLPVSDSIEKELHFVPDMDEDLFDAGRRFRRQPVPELHRQRRDLEQEGSFGSFAVDLLCQRQESCG